MGHHTHLTLQEREDIMVMRREGKGVTQIAGAIGRSKSTVSRELGRNMCAASTPHPYYRASTAQARYEQWRRACVRPRILDDPGTFELVRGNSWRSSGRRSRSRAGWRSSSGPAP